MSEKYEITYKEDISDTLYKAMELAGDNGEDHLEGMLRALLEKLEHVGMC